MKQFSAKTCNRCHDRFLCGAAFSLAACWCIKYPAFIELSENKECLCERCLMKKIKSRINVFMDRLNSTGTTELDISKYQTVDDIEGIDYYIDNGNYVFTKWRHLKRGYCCESGCRNCPYGYSSESRD